MTIVYSTRAARRITWTLFIAQSLASAALIANTTVVPIIGAELSGRPALAGLPGTLLLLGAASTAQPAAQLMQRLGSRWSLALGFSMGLAGMLLSGGALLMQSFPIFLLGLLLIGGARGVVDQSRYAAADAHEPAQRARAISTIVFAGTIGAVVGPALVGPSGALLSGLGLPALSGPMWIGAVLFAVAGALIAALLRPDPRQITRSLAAGHPTAQADARDARPLRAVMRLPNTQRALAALVTGQVVMVLIMAVTGLHMHDHHHGLDAVATVIMAHTLGMYGLSVLTGPLADRVGRSRAIGGGALLLITGSLLAPTSLQTVWLALALFLVGLGWNLCYIAGSSLLADGLAPAERGRIQGVTELMINLASAASSLGSGILLARLSYAALGMLGALIALVPLALIGWQITVPARVAPGDA
ncbi:MAG: MFS transporter [Chloroflexales bacterium]|nr:MFS transporter [Chloroflexales bacterium]